MEWFGLTQGIKPDLTAIINRHRLSLHNPYLYLSIKLRLKACCNNFFGESRANLLSVIPSLSLPITSGMTL